MDQVLAIEKVCEKISKTLDMSKDISKDELLDTLCEINNDLAVFLKNGIDFKTVVDSLDDSIFITDANGKVLYVNPAHKKNTSILPEEIVGRTVYDILADGNLFTGGATTDVIKTKKKAFRLSTVKKQNPPSVGYAVGVPIFDNDGELRQVVVSSRPILSLKALRDDFGSFLAEANSLNEQREKISILQNSNSTKIKSLNLIGSYFDKSHIWDTIQRAAPTDATVLITGESGVGKEIIANEIYRLSNRNSKTFVKVNCASIPLNLLESELFGYEKGAFSGAGVSGKQGLFEVANGGTILLDEIGDMPMDLQVKLLRAIQSREITRVGGTKPISLDIRFIAATNSNLKEKIAEGTFRQDLFYRLNVIPIYIPPLRERMEDLEELCNHFISLYTKKHNREFVLSSENLDIMKQYNWPGNIRELENVIEYLTICSSGTNELDSKMLRSILDISQNDKVVPATGTLQQSLNDYEKQLIEATLADSKNLRDAGTRLGVNASTISRKIKQYNIDYHNSGNE